MTPPSLTDDTSSTRGRWGSFHARLWAVVLVGAMLSMGLFDSFRRAQKDRDEAEFQRRIGIYMAMFQERRNGTEDVLRTLRALFHENPELSRETFSLVIQDLAVRVQGVVQALVWAPRVTFAQRSSIEAAMVALGFEGFEFREGDVVHVPEELPSTATDREEYFPVMFLEPYEGNEHVLGYDLAFAELKSTLEKARAAGQIRVSGQVDLLYGGSIRPGFVAVIPVYAQDLVPPEGARDNQLTGFVVAAFVLDEVFERLADSAPELNLDVLALDHSGPSGRVVMGFRIHPRSAVALNANNIGEFFTQQPFQAHEVAMSDRTWSLLFRRSANWQTLSSPWYPYILLVGGLLCTGLLAQFLTASTLRARRVQQLVDQRTQELAEANKLLKDEIRERRQIDRQLAHDRNLLRTLIDRLPDAVCVTDANGCYLTLNKAHRRLLGLTVEGDALHRPVGEVGLKPIAQVLDSGSAELLRLGTPLLNHEVTIRLESDQTMNLLVSKLPLRGVSGQPSGLVILCRDMTEARLAETNKQALQQKLLETQKLESLGLLAGGIAHDFNNLLTSMLGNAGLARVELPGDSRAHEYLAQIETTTGRAADLCRQMLAYSGKGRFVVRHLNLSQLVDKTRELLLSSVSKKAKLEFALAPDLAPVSGDATQLQQILLNLVINASDAIGDRDGVIRIVTGRTHVNGAYLAGAAFTSDIPEGDYVFLEVTDNGCGMSPDVQAKIFDPFFTTKFTGRGLGLAAVLGIVRGHKGAMKVYSDPGQGSTFKLALPALQGEVETDTRSLDAEDDWRGRGTILLVEDEDAVRLVATRLLERAGFKVQVAHDGREGVDLFSARPDDYRAVLLDLTMPRMDGEEAFREMRKINPQIRVLLMSGYSPQEADEKFAGKGLGGFIQKPFGGRELIHRLRILIEADAP